MKRNRTRISRKRTTRKHKRQFGGTRNITMGILCWKSPKTIENTLTSYKKNGLLRLVKPTIYFQERTKENDELAEKYGIKDVMGGEANTGIIGAMIDLIKKTETKYFIFAECDFELVHDKSTTEKILKEAVRLMEEKDVQVVRLRDKKRPGEPLGSRDLAPVTDDELPNYKFGSDFLYKIEVLMFPGNIEPDKAFPGLFEKIEYGTPWYKTDSLNAPWSNNIFIAKTDFLKERLLPLLEQNRQIHSNNMEEYLMKNLGSYNVAAGNGLFMHNRLDR